MAVKRVVQLGGRLVGNLTREGCESIESLRSQSQLVAIAVCSSGLNHTSKLLLP